MPNPGYRTGAWDAGQVGCRTGEMQEWRDAGLEGCRTGGIQDWRDEKKDRFDAGYV